LYGEVVFFHKYVRLEGRGTSILILYMNILVPFTGIVLLKAFNHLWAVPSVLALISYIVGVACVSYCIFVSTTLMGDMVEA
jgi:hypothetical protein